MNQHSNGPGRLAGRTTALAAVAVLAAAGPLGGFGRAAHAQPPATAAPFATPDTDSCPNRTAPAPPIDASEVPAPGEKPPAPLPIAEPPVGGPVLGGCGVLIPAGAPPVPADISASAWTLSDLDTGKVLAAKDPHGRYRPASTIKVLLAIVALREIDLDHTVVGTAADSNADGTRVGIGLGGVYTNRQLIQALIMASGNDAAHAVAMQLGGVEQTVQKMNEQAKSLGGLDTRAATPSGLDGPGMSSSAYDMSLFFREAMTIPTFAELIHTEEAPFPGYPADPRRPGDRDHPGFPIGNDNHLLYEYEGALGGKTGYTDDARQTFVAGAERNGHRLAITLMHADIRPVRPWVQAARLLDYGFALEKSGTAPIGELVGPGSTALSDRAGSDPDRLLLAEPPANTSSSAAVRETVVALGGVAILLLLVAAAIIGMRRRR